MKNVFLWFWSSALIVSDLILTNILTDCAGQHGADVVSTVAPQKGSGFLPSLPAEWKLSLWSSMHVFPVAAT